MKSNQGLSGEVLIAKRCVIRAVDHHSRKLSQEYNLTGPQALVLKEISVTKGINPANWQNASVSVRLPSQISSNDLSHAIASNVFAE